MTTRRHQLRAAEGQNPCKSAEADARIRTADPFITSEVLYQLSYVGGGLEFSGCAARKPSLVCTIEELE